jgi:hypothetical protein
MELLENTGKAKKNKEPEVLTDRQRQRLMRLALARIMEVEIVPCQPGVTPFDADGFNGLGFVSEDPHVGIPDCGTSMPTASCAKAAELMVRPYARR